ncbi:MAG: hypothetical protein AB1488_01210 [Nitrospirota bacterium]
MRRQGYLSETCFNPPIPPLVKGGKEGLDSGLSPKGKNENGAALIAAVFLIIVLGFLGAMFVSMMATSTTVSTKEVKSSEVFFAVESGREWAMRWLYQQTNWDGSASPPTPPAVKDIDGNTIGTFTYSITWLTQNKLSANIGAAATTIPVYSTSGFPDPNGAYVRTIMIEDEAIDYTDTDATNFLNAQRERHGTSKTSHSKDTPVYIATYLTSGITSTARTIPVNSTDGFPNSGKVKMASEYIDYTEKDATNLKGCRRGAISPSTGFPTTATSHPVDRAVKLYANQALMTVTGSASGSITATRKIEASVYR